MDFTTRHEPFVEDLHRGVRDVVGLFRFAPSVLHDLSDTWEQQDRSAERNCMALPGVQVPDALYSHTTHPSEDDVITRH